MVMSATAPFDAAPDIAGYDSGSRGPATQSNAGVPPTPTSTPGQYVQQSTISNGMQSLPGDTPGMVAHGPNQQVMVGNLPRVILTSQSIAKKDRRLLTAAAKPQFPSQWRMRRIIVPYCAKFFTCGGCKINQLILSRALAGIHCRIRLAEHLLVVTARAFLERQL
jgi:hypothetical protein